MQTAQIVFYALMTSAVVLIALIVLQVTARRVRFLMSEVQSLRREIKLVDEGLQTVNEALTSIARNAEERR